MTRGAKVTEIDPIPLASHLFGDYTGRDIGHQIGDWLGASTVRTLREIRLAAGKSLADAAAALRISKQAYWRKELGMRRLYDYEALILADLYGAPVAEIISSPREITDSVTIFPAK